MKTNRLLLVGAVICGLFAMGVAFVYLRQQTQSNEPEATTTILVAEKDLPAGTRIDVAKHVKKIEVPTRLKDLASLAVAPGHIDLLENQVINRPIAEGTPVMYADLIPVRDLKLDGERRALSIAVDGANAVSGLVMPGDYVKIYVTRPVPKEKDLAAGQLTPEQTAFAALAAAQNYAVTQWTSELISPVSLKVLAVGPYLTGYRQTLPSVSGGRNQMLRYNTVTLDVSEAQAEKILADSGAGQLPLTLILCPPMDGSEGEHKSASNN